MKKYLIIALLLLAVGVSAQNVTQKELTGKWFTVKIDPVTEMPLNELNELKKLFNGSTFDFKADGKFIITLPGDTMGMKEMFANTSWIFDDKLQTIKIGAKGDSYGIMGIKVAKVGTKVFFELLESGAKAEVVKGK
ncbi:MAG: hypothetical protein EOO45_10610 [Flavobacterium sp.]|nr:MAG: hypothetical protein EOO45_10610 [Flavobacterium sp.]